MLETIAIILVVGGLLVIVSWWASDDARLDRAIERGRQADEVRQEKIAERGGPDPLGVFKDRKSRDQVWLATKVAVTPVFPLIWAGSLYRGLARKTGQYAEEGRERARRQRDLRDGSRED